MDEDKPAMEASGSSKPTTHADTKALTVDLKAKPKTKAPSVKAKVNTKSHSIDLNAEVMGKKNISWKKEVARRHVVSAVMRLNRETNLESSGILVNKEKMPVKEKKKVLFADGIPPGHSSSVSSDEEATIKLIRKRLRRKERLLLNKNKDNEISAPTDHGTTGSIEIKNDPELWDAPPPPPPPGSPPSILPQPQLLRPPSSHRLLYFHFDPVLNLMYASPMENAVPPRLLKNNGKTMVEDSRDTQVAKLDASPDSLENCDETPEQLQSTDESQSPPQQALDSYENINSPNDLFKENITAQCDVTTSPVLPPANFKPSSPSQLNQNIIKMRLNNNSPEFYQQQSPFLPPTCLDSLQPEVQSQPIMLGYQGWNFNGNNMPQRQLSSPNITNGLNYGPVNPIHNPAFNLHDSPQFRSLPTTAAITTTTTVNVNRTPPHLLPVFQTGYGDLNTLTSNLIMTNSSRQTSSASPINFSALRLKSHQNPPQSSLAESLTNRFGSPTIRAGAGDRNDLNIGLPLNHLFRFQPPPIPVMSQSQLQSLATNETAEHPYP